jgi:hypothetical protein
VMKNNTLVEDVGNERYCVYMGAEKTWEVCVPSSQFCCQYKTTEQMKSFVLFLFWWF